MLAGCMVGSTGGPGGPPDDNTSPDGGDAVDGATATGDGATFACRNKITAVGDGHHNPGQDCMGACHNHGFTLAGTIYSGGATLSGASITIKDATNNTFDMVSQANGNFYTINALVYPITIVASLCPNVATMSAPMTVKAGCNSCHGGGAQPRIHLP